MLIRVVSSDIVSTVKISFNRQLKLSKTYNFTNKPKESVGSELESKATRQREWRGSSLWGWMFLLICTWVVSELGVLSPLSATIWVYLDSIWLSLGPFTFGSQFLDSRPLQLGATSSIGHLSWVTLCSKLFQGLTLAKLWYKNCCFPPSF